MNSACLDDNCVAEIFKGKCEFCHLTIVCQKPEPVGHDTEVSAVYGNVCVCKAQVYNWVIKFLTGMPSLCDTDRPVQTCKQTLPTFRCIGAFEARTEGFFLTLTQWTDSQLMQMHCKTRGPY